MKKTLSVVLATFNEEKNLASCLDSAKDIADEIVIVDGTSSDKTVEIAKKYGAKIKITNNKPNFHINKQMAIDMATKDWILQLDADEHLSEEQRREIKEVLEKDPKEFNGFWMARRNWFLGRFLLKGGQYPDYTLRFYRRGKGMLPQKDVHEQAVVEGNVGYLKNPLLHYPYKNFHHYVSKWNNYNNFFANQIREEQKSKNIFGKIFSFFDYLIIKPVYWFLMTYIRHKGFVDLWQGFVFSFFSALRFPVSYVKYLGYYRALSFLIILLSAVIRFYNFPNRFGLGADNARDALIALEALKRHQLPLMGPFSSAGAFVTGGIYYWLLMISYLFLPFVISAPWILTGIVSVATVICMLYLGRILLGKRFSVIVGILAATSPILIGKSIELSNPSFITIFSILTIIFFVLLWQRKKLKFSLLAGLSVGLALNMHYQAINLLIFLPFVFLVRTLSFKNRIEAFVFMLFGILIPSLPILYWDSHQGFANTRNILDYFLIGQYRIYVPNSWKLFLFNYFPNFWSLVVSNISFLGLLLFLSSTLLFVANSLRRKISGPFLSLGIIFAILIIVNKFYHAERSMDYLLYFSPFILIFTAYLINQLFLMKNKMVKIIAFIVLLVLIVLNSFSIKNALSYKNSLGELSKISKFLSSKFLDTKFSLYDYKSMNYSLSIPLSLVMRFQNKTDINGKKIGIGCYSRDCSGKLSAISEGVISVLDLKNATESAFDKNRGMWASVDQTSVYDGSIGWLSKNQLKSTFSLKNYIMERL